MTFSKNTLANIIAPLILALCAGAIIFYRFPSIPQNISLDEVEFIKLSLSLDQSPYIPYSQMATGHATLYFYILLASIKLFGTTILAVRFPPAFLGVIDVVLLYFIFRLLFENRKKIELSIQISFPFLLAFIFGSLRWYFNFARFGFEASTVLFFELFGILFYLLYRKDKKTVFLLLTGVFAGLAYNSYTPGRIFFILPLALLCLDFLKQKPTRNFIVKNLIAFAVPFIIITTPLNWYFTKHDDNRIYEQFYLQNEQLSIQERGSFLWQNIMSVGGMFVGKGDMNGRHNYPGKPMLNPLLGLLFIVGFILSLKGWKKFPQQLFLLFFAVGILPPLLTYPWENPNSLRAVTAIPAVVYFIGQALLLITKIPYHKRFIMYGIFFIIGLSSIYEIRTYFVYQSLVFPTSFEIHPTLLQPYLNGHYIFDPDKLK